MAVIYDYLGSIGSFKWNNMGVITTAPPTGALNTNDELDFLELLNSDESPWNPIVGATYTITLITSFSGPDAANGQAGIQMRTNPDADIIKSGGSGTLSKTATVTHSGLTFDILRNFLSEGLTYSIDILNLIIDETIPFTLNITLNGSSEPQLDWNASTLDGLIGYKVYRDGELLDTLGNVLTYTDETTTPGQCYDYQVFGYGTSEVELYRLSTGNTNGLHWNIRDHAGLNDQLPENTVPIELSNTNGGHLLKLRDSGDNIYTFPSTCNIEVDFIGSTINFDAVSIGSTSPATSSIGPSAQVIIGNNGSEDSSITDIIISILSNVTDPSNIQNQCTPATPEIILSTQSIAGPAIQLDWITTEPFPIGGYKIFRDGSLIATIGDVLTYTDSDVTSGTCYDYYVQAFASTATVPGVFTYVNVEGAPWIWKVTRISDSSVHYIDTSDFGGSVPMNAGDTMELVYTSNHGTPYPIFDIGNSYKLYGGTSGADGNKCNWVNPSDDTTFLELISTSGLIVTDFVVVPFSGLKVICLITSSLNIGGQIDTLRPATDNSNTQNQCVPEDLGIVLTTSIVGPTDVQLDWTPTTTLTPPITGYRIFRDDSLINTVDGDTLTFTDSGLTPGTCYDYRIEAFIDGITTYTPTPGDLGPEKVIDPNNGHTESFNELTLNFTPIPQNTADCLITFDVSNYLGSNDGDSILVHVGDQDAAFDFTGNGSYSIAIPSTSALGGDITFECFSSEADISNLSVKFYASEEVSPEQTQDSNTENQCLEQGSITLSSPSVIESDVSLSWTDTTGLVFDHYSILRDGIEIGTVSSDTFTYEDTTVLSGRTYLYEVVGIGDSNSESNSIPVTVPSTTPYSIDRVVTLEPNTQYVLMISVSNHTINDANVRYDSLSLPSIIDNGVYIQLFTTPSSFTDSVLQISGIGDILFDDIIINSIVPDGTTHPVTTEVTTIVLKRLGELLRLICYHDNTDEFIFNVVQTEKLGWCIEYSSPLYMGMSDEIGAIKAYENTPGVFDLSKYPLLNSGFISTTTDGDKNVMNIQGQPGLQVGIGDISNLKDFGVKVDPDVDYEITFLVEQQTNDPSLTFKAYGFDKDGNNVDLLSVVDGSAQNFFFEKIQLNRNDIYYMVRGIIYNQNHSLISSPDGLLNIGYGQQLKFSGDLVKIVPQLFVDDSSTVINIYDFKVRPLATKYETGFIQSNNFIEMWLKNNNKQISKSVLENNIRRYLIPYNSTFKIDYMESPFIASSPTNTDTTIDVLWTGVVEAGSYSVYNNGKMLNTTPGNTYQITGLTSGTLYSIKVIARDFNGVAMIGSNNLFVSTN